MTQPSWVGQFNEAYWSVADTAFGITSQLVGTMRTQRPVTNSSTTKMTPLASHSTSRLRWNQSAMLTLPRPFFDQAGVQNIVGRFCVRTCQPVRMMSTIRNAVK